MASREARALFGAAREIPASLREAFASSAFAHDLPFQRQSAWAVWTSLFTPVSTADGFSLDPWQSWYAVEDLGRIFRQLYESLSKVGRQQRQAFASETIASAIRWHDTEQFTSPQWDAGRWRDWLEQYRSPETERALGGLSKILMNRSALVYLLTNYRDLTQCWRRLEPCRIPALPEGSAFLKAAWRRSGDGFAIPFFQTAELEKQLAAGQWAESSEGPRADADTYHMQTLSGQTFHLVGMHFMLKLADHWAWSSLWLGPTPGQDLAADQPRDFPYKDYRLCTLDSFEDDWRESDSTPWSPELRRWQESLRAANLPHWCSNPYLELGSSNQKTNCVGCHQHAGLPWTNQEFKRRLQDDLPSLLDRQSEEGPTDQVWSLISGPSPLAAPLAEIIDYFDVYDPYNFLEQEN